MHGTVVCALTEGAENGDAVAQASAMSERLGLRLVLAHVVKGIAELGDGGDESITMKADRIAAARELAELVRDHGLDDRAEARVATGDPATLVGRIASEEAADVIIVGARRRGWAGRSLESKLAEELEGETPVPVLVAPPRARSHRRVSANGGLPR